jgi:hypothetical protein
MEHTPSWEPDSRTFGQEIIYLLRNLKDHYNFYAPVTGSCPEPKSTSSRALRPPEDGNHMPKHGGVEKKFERIKHLRPLEDGNHTPKHVGIEKF